MANVPVTTITIPVDGRSAVALEAGQPGPPVLTIMTAEPPLVVAIRLPGQPGPGEARFARDLAATAALYAAEVERFAQASAVSPPA